MEKNLGIAYSSNKKRNLLLGITKKRRDIFRDYLKTLNLGLENRLNARVGLLSGGERQALSLLMATFIEPNILLFDENSADLDTVHSLLIKYYSFDFDLKFNYTSYIL